jgi:prephenate dehydrogenase
MNLEDTPCIGIIGGLGQMGRWYTRQLEHLGFRVLTADLQTDLLPRDLPSRCEVVLLSVPRDIAVEMAAEIGPLLRPDQLLMDICSQKKVVVDAMVKSTKAEVVGTHPLFGPFPDSFEGQNVILCPGRGERWQKWLEGTLTGAGAVVTIADAADHDRNMALTQGFIHLVSVCMGKMMQRLEIHPRDILPFSTPTFRIKIDLIGRLLAQDLNLYESLIRDNDTVPELLDLFLDVIENNRADLFSNEKGRGADFMKEIRDFFGDFCQQAQQESSVMLDAVYPKN